MPYNPAFDARLFANAPISCDYPIPQELNGLDDTDWVLQTAPLPPPQYKNKIMKYALNLDRELTVGNTQTILSVLAIGGALTAGGALAVTMAQIDGSAFTPLGHEHSTELLETSSSVNAFIQEYEFNSVNSALISEGFGKSANRIFELKELAKFEENQKPLSMDSVLGFSKFISNFKNIGEPILGLFAEGTLSADWQVDDNKYLLIEFLDSNEASFAMIKPADGNPGKEFELNGKGSHADLLSTLEKHGVTKWRE